VASGQRSEKSRCLLCSARSCYPLPGARSLAPSLDCTPSIGLQVTLDHRPVPDTCPSLVAIGYFQYAIYCYPPLKIYCSINSVYSDNIDIKQLNCIKPTSLKQFFYTSLKHRFSFQCSYLSKYHWTKRDSTLLKFLIFCPLKQTKIIIQIQWSSLLF